MSKPGIVAALVGIGGFLIYAAWEDHDWIQINEYYGWFGKYRETETDPFWRNVTRVGTALAGSVLVIGGLGGGLGLWDLARFWR